MTFITRRTTITAAAGLLAGLPTPDALLEKRGLV